MKIFKKPVKTEVYCTTCKCGFTMQKKDWKNVKIEKVIERLNIPRDCGIGYDIRHRTYMVTSIHCPVCNQETWIKKECIE